MNPSAVLSWMHEHIAYWRTEVQMAERALLQSPAPGELARAELRVRKMLANRIIHQLETLENEVNRERP